MAAVLSTAQLQRFLPALPDAAMWAESLRPALERFEITTPARISAFLAQVAHESDEFRYLTEGLSYTAKRLMLVWPKRFPTLKSALPYERQPEKLANYVYAKRLGNGDSASGDGWRYRGRGLLQTTGRGNYRATGLALGAPLEQRPELLETPPMAALAAAQYWQSRGCNPLADDRNDDNDDEDFVEITKIINGGKIGLEARRQYWARAKASLS